jgi:hypothetical protein
MKLQLNDLKHVSFHDGTLDAVNISEGNIEMTIDSGAIGPPLPETAGKEWIIREIKFTCEQVSLNETELWTDTEKGLPHPTPQKPIYDILNTEVKDDFLELSGFTEDQNWGVWKIKAESFTLAFKSQEEFKC